MYLDPNLILAKYHCQMFTQERENGKKYFDLVSTYCASDIKPQEARIFKVEKKIQIF